MAAVLTKRGNLGTDTHIGKAHGKHEGRYWRDASVSQGMLEIGSKPWEVRRREAWNNPSPAPSGGAWTCVHLDRGCLASRCVRQCRTVLAIQLGTLSWQTHMGR